MAESGGVYILGVGSTAFQRWPTRSLPDLAAEAVRAALADAGLADGAAAVEQVWFGNCAMDRWGQSNIRGQVCLDPLVRAGTLPAGLPILNVEAGCATGAAALHGAYRDILSGEQEVCLAVGAEKTFIPDDPAAVLALFSGGIDQLEPARWQQFYASEAEAHGLSFAPHPYRIVFVDVHALHARHHMARYGTTLEHLAHIAVKNRAHGAHNPLAQHAAPVDLAGVLGDRVVVEPFTRSMCAPISDGAAAAVVCGGRWLQRQPPEVRARAIRVRGMALQGGTWRGLAEDNVLARAAHLAWKRAGIQPQDVDIAEVHDASTFCELQATELLGFCAPGEGGAYAASGATALGGSRPVNLSGGLVSKGHPLAATGLGQIQELVTQLRGEAGARQQPGQPAIGLQHNAGGMVGLDEALCAVTVLERPG